VSLRVLEGLRPWLIQRVSALVIMAWLLYAAWCYAGATEFSYPAWHAWAYAPLNSLFLGLFALALLFHAWVGMRDVILDYVHHLVLRLLILSLIQLMLILCGLWLLRILLLPSGGG
jgi:succinate dehydrogenase / fumarate reductase membrane anchor subunit